MIAREEYISDQQAFLRCLNALLEALEPMVEAANTRDEVQVGAKVKRASTNLESAKQELRKLALRPRMSELLEGWTEDELAVLREKLGVIEDDEEDEQDG